MKTLFDPPLAHRDDAITSYKASDRMRGKAPTHRLIVLDAIRNHPGKTRAEIACIIEELDYLEVVRRVSDLKRAGFVLEGSARFCAVQKTECTTLYARTER